MKIADLGNCTSPLRIQHLRCDVRMQMLSVLKNMRQRRTIHFNTVAYRPVAKRWLWGRCYVALAAYTCAVTSRNYRRGVASRVLCGSAPRSLRRNCSVNTPLQQWINKNNSGSGVLCGSTRRLYNKDLTQVELELSRVPELGAAAENWVPELAVSRITEKKWQGIRLRKEDFIVCCTCRVTIMNPLPGYD
jgi:hypothetical protein